MKLIYFLYLFIPLVLGVDSSSGRIHIVEKIYFYFNYKIEGIVGGDRTFAPDCQDCDFTKFVKHIVEVNKNGFSYPDPGQDLQSIRQAVQKITVSKQRNNGNAWVDIRKLMPSVPESTVQDQEYKELYRRTKQWVTDIQGKIDDISDPDQKKNAQGLFKGAKICVDEMKGMRYGGYKNEEFLDAEKKFQNQWYGQSKAVVHSKPIKPENVGNQKKYKELDLAKIKDMNIPDFEKDLEAWQEKRNVDDSNTRRHLAVDNVLGELKDCYPKGT